MKSLITIVFLFLITASNASAQCTKDTDCKGNRVCQNGECVELSTSIDAKNSAWLPPSKKFGIYALYSMPIGEYANDTNGLAEPGFGGGLNFVAPLPSQGVFWATDFGLVINSTNTETMDGTSYLNFYALTGPKFQGPVNYGVDIYGLVGIGANLVSPPSFDSNNGREMKTDPGFDIAFGLGGGIIINQKFDICVRYLNFGEPEMDANIIVSGKTERTIRVKQKISMFVVSAGIYF